MQLFLDGLEPGKTEALIRYVYVVYVPYVCPDVAIYIIISMFFPCLLIVGHSFQPSFQDIPRAPTMNPSQLDISGSKRLQKRRRRPRLRNAEECGSILQVETVYVPSPKCVFLGNLFRIAMGYGTSPFAIGSKR